MGLVWPEADEDLLREESDAWRTYAARLDEIGETADTAARTAIRNNGGDAIGAFDEYWASYVNDVGYIESACRAAELIATALSAAAIIITGLKAAVIAQLTFLAAVWAVAQAVAAESGAATLAFAWEVTARVRLAISSIMDEATAALRELGPQALTVAEELVGGAVDRLQAGKEGLPWNEGRNPALNYRYLDPALVAELDELAVKYSVNDLVAIGRTPNGDLTFLESGRLYPKASGIIHIIDVHGSEFDQRGIPRSQVSDVLMKAISEGEIVGTQKNRPIYEFEYQGDVYRMAIQIGDNGYIVSANFKSSRRGR